jgi:hypothetical protein
MRTHHGIAVLLAITTGCTSVAVDHGPARPPVAPGPQMAAPELRPPSGPDGPITAAQRGEAIEGLLRALNDTYVFPDRGKEVVKAVRARAKRGEYDAIATGHALATALTRDVNAVLKDAHFHVRFSKERVPERKQADKPSPEELAKYDEFEKQVNGGFEKVERLPGNIGYLEVRSFEFPGRGVAAAAAAMSFLSETDALIVDIRRNGGGSPDAVAALCSHFFDEPVHLNDLYFRPADETRQFWTAPVTGKPYTERPIYVLVSKRTGSAAEEFAYNLQNLKRATVVGEVTWGGAHPGDMVRLGDHFMAFVPNGRAINPISKTNWEGVGVKPDIATAPDEALRVAQIEILGRRIEVEKDPETREALSQRRRELEGK